MRSRGVGNVITISMLLGGILQLILWLPAGGSIGASYTFSVLYGIFGGQCDRTYLVWLMFMVHNCTAGYIGLYPVCRASHNITSRTHCLQVYLARYLDHNKLASITGLFFTSELPGMSPVAHVSMTELNCR